MMIVDQKNDAAPDSHRPASSPVSLVVDYDGAEDLVLDYTENLSTGRVFLDTARPLDAGTHVHLTLTFPGLLEPFVIRGVVQRAPEVASDARGVGVELEQGEGRERLRDLVQRVRARDPGVVMRLVRILVVEDNPHVAQLIRNGLRGSGRREFQGLAFNFRTATNGRDALEILRNASFDVLIVDIYLPILDGAQLIEQVRQNEQLRGLPIIAVSAGGVSAREAALAAGANVFLEKPMRLRQIVDAMQGIIQTPA